MAERLHFDTTVLDMDSVQLRDLLKHSVVIFAISTTGQGEMPQNARIFWKTLLSGALKPGILRKVRFTSFGLGDSSYARFNVAHRMVCSRLLQLGAHAFCERGEGNEQHPEGHSAGFREWFVALKRQLLETCPLPTGTEPIAEDTFLEPKWKLVSQEEVPATNGNTSNGINGRAHHASREEAAKLDSLDVPSSALIPIRGEHVATVVANDHITAVNHFQDVRVVDLRLEDSVRYRPGAVAVVYPKNFPNDVQQFIELMHWQEIADSPLTLIFKETSARSCSPSPLRHLDLAKTCLTLRWLLENVLDIMSIPRRSFFASLAHFTGTTTSDEIYQKDRLLELADPELIDELWDYTTRPKRTILEVMQDFTTVRIPWPYALSALPTMKGRQFSIASGGPLTIASNENTSKTRVQLLVAIAKPPNPIIKYRARHGVCTRYIATLEPNQQISLGMQPGYLDVQPEDLRIPAVMIGPGTGLAPMRSMIWQRRQWAAQNSGEDDNIITPRRPAGDILIFGCRNENGDYFFREEWEALQQEGLRVLTAFSRDTDKPRQYVQDVIRTNASSLRSAIVEQTGNVYVCGSSGNMPKGVREALVDVLAVAEGLGKREEAERYLNGMEKEGRYKQETW